MDMREDATEKPAWWSPIAAWWQQWQQRNLPRTQRIAQTSMLALRVWGWQERSRRWWATWNTGVQRLRLASKLAYYILPSPLAQVRREVSTSKKVAPRVRIICNPTSGSGRGSNALRDLEDTAVWLSEHGLPTEVSQTEHAGHAAELAHEAVQRGMDMVVAAGGDGTVSEVLQSLVGHSTALGVLPLGTANVWARETGIPLHLDQAREVLLHGVRRRIDVGRANDRYFLLMAGIGFDAEVARRVQDSMLTQMGLKIVDYITTTGWLAIAHQPARVTMRYDHNKHRTFNALMVVISNTRLYGGALTFAKDALADDGLFDVVTMENGSVFYRLSVLIQAFLGQKQRNPKARTLRTHTIHIESTPPLPVQVDGDVIGHLPMTFSVMSNALSVVVPVNAPEDIFHRPPMK